MKNYIKNLAVFGLIILIAISTSIISYADYSRVSESVNLRERPGTDSRVIKLVPMGYEVSVQSSGDGWSKVIFDGSTGYVKSEFIEVIKGTPPAAQVGVKASIGASPTGAPTSASAAAGDGEDNATASAGGVLRYGCEGDAVRDLQNILTDKGVYLGPINGKFGPLTEEAVMKYQEDNGLEQDGVVGSETYKKLTEKPHPAGTYRNGDEGEEVRKIQKALKDKGFYSGPTNAKFGPLTEEAVKKFQRANNLEADGIAGKVTLNLLYAAAKSASASGSGDSGASKSGSGGSKAAVAPNGVELMEWSNVKNVFKIGLSAKVYDVRTGISYNVKSFSNGKHADVEPVTEEDTQLLKKTYGGVWSWDPRPVWVTVNGHTIAGSINGMPHGGGVNNSNGMNGQVCLHFKGSSTHNGNAAFAKLHQDAVDEAWNAAKK